MKAKIVVLYEDKRVQAKGYGPHELVKACVLDVVDQDDQGDRAALMANLSIEARPLKGSGNIYTSCRNVSLIAPRGQPVVAVLDRDRVHDLLGLPKPISQQQVEKRLKDESDAPAQLHVCLLEENLESVIEAIKVCAPGQNADILARALDKEPNAQDVLLRRVAHAPTRAIRECILQRVPSLKAIVELLISLLAPPSGLTA